MYGVLAVVCCDTCTPGPDKGIPAEICPDDPETPHEATVTIAVSVIPKAYCVVTSFTCTPQSAPCSGEFSPTGLIAAKHGTDPGAGCKSCSFEAPVPTIGGSWDDAKVSVAWPSYTTTTTSGSHPTTTYTTTCHDCDSLVESLGPTHEDTFVVTLKCSGAENTETFGDPLVDGISGSATVSMCCDDCGCGVPTKCTKISVSLTARWSKTLTMPVITTEGECLQCYEMDNLIDYGVVKSDGTSNDVDYVVYNTATAVFQRSILVSQAATRLAPGPYTVLSCATATVDGQGLSTVSVDPTGSQATDACSWGGDCSCWGGTGGVSETSSCAGDSLLTERGWTVTVTVAA